VRRKDKDSKETKESKDKDQNKEKSKESKALRAALVHHLVFGAILLGAALRRWGSWGAIH